MWQTLGWMQDLLEDDSFVPKEGSTLYTRKDYWDYRFSKEEAYDWLAQYKQLREYIRGKAPLSARVLVVGCGNSRLSADMAADGYTSILSSEWPPRRQPYRLVLLFLHRLGVFFCTGWVFF